MKSVSNKDYNIKEEQKQYKHLEVNLHFKCKLNYANWPIFYILYINWKRCYKWYFKFWYFKGRYWKREKTERDWIKKI